jgi:hypothetical protein
MTTQYLTGNHTIAERMFRHDPSVMLHAPLRTVLYVDPVGETKLAVDQPSLLFDSYDKPEIAVSGANSTPTEGHHDRNGRRQQGSGDRGIRHAVQPA